MGYSKAFDLIAQIAIAADAAPIHKHDGCWEFDAGKWRVAVNGHKEKKLESSGAPVEAFHAYVTYNGWPAGIMSPFGGVIAGGEAANEDTFIAALEAKLCELKEDKP